MPVESGLPAGAADQETFHKIDRVVMGEAFVVQNSLGRFLNEKIFKMELADRCDQAGLDVRLEEPLKVRHGPFSKIYFLDFIVEKSIPYELKCAEALSGSHQNQLLNYLLLLEWKHGKLLNFRPARVESRFVSTSLNRCDRTSFEIHEESWIESNEADRLLKKRFIDFLADLGLCLDVSLYREALVCLMNDFSPGRQNIEILSAGRVLGTHSMCLLDDETAWHISTIGFPSESYGSHLRQLLCHTRLSRLHWINLGHNVVSFLSLKK
jgi:GxxExxY protein